MYVYVHSSFNILTVSWQPTGKKPSFRKSSWLVHNAAPTTLYTLTFTSSGVGIRPKPTSKVVPLIRLDMDNIGKGIHFNATRLADSSMKLAAVITPTAHFTEAKRKALYLDYIKGIQNRSAQFIWDWWREGEVPWRPN